MPNDDLLKGLTPEQAEKIKNCKTQEEVLTIVKEEGIELSDDQLEAITGGFSEPVSACPQCGNTETEFHVFGDRFFYACPKCGKIF